MTHRWTMPMPNTKCSRRHCAISSCFKTFWIICDGFWVEQKYQVTRIYKASSVAVALHAKIGLSPMVKGNHHSVWIHIPYHIHITFYSVVICNDTSPSQVVEAATHWERMFWGGWASNNFPPNRLGKVFLRAKKCTKTQESIPVYLLYSIYIHVYLIMFKHILYSISTHE